MRVLAIDTSSDSACVGLVGPNDASTVRTFRGAAKHGETLIARIDEVLAEAGATRASIDLVAVGLGPGSFTGIRVGIATAKGVALGLGKPLVGVRTSRVLAPAIPRDQRGIVAIDGKKGEVFASAWAHDARGITCLAEDVHGAPEVIARQLREVVGPGSITVVGTGARAYPAFMSALGEGAALLDTEHDAPRATHLAWAALDGWDGEDHVADVEAVYVRPADALLPTPRA